MRIHELQPAENSRTARKRVGRGIGSGLGKTSGRPEGTAFRSGGGKAFFEGGQMPLVRRLPKRGFTNIFQRQFAEVNVVTNRFAPGTVVTPQLLQESGLIKSVKDGIKILGAVRSSMH